MPTWVVWASLGMGALAGVLVIFGFLGVRWHLSREWHFGRWSERIEVVAVELIQAELRVAELQVQLAELAADAPDDFNAPVFQAARVGARLERAAYAEAERRGLIPPGVFAPLPGPLLPSEPLVEPETTAAAAAAAAPLVVVVPPAPAAEPSPLPSVAPPRPVPAFTLVGGQLVRTLN